MAKTDPCPTCGVDPDVLRELERAYAMQLTWQTVCANVDRQLHDYEATVRYLTRQQFTPSRRVPDTWLRITETGGTTVRVPRPDDAKWIQKMADLVFVLAVEFHQGEVGVLADIARAGVRA